MKKTQHKIPATLMQTRIKQAVQNQIQDEFRRGYEAASNDITGLYKPKLEEQKKQLLEQSKRHQNRIEELEGEILKQPQLVEAKLESFTANYGFFVGNKSTSWKWFSNVAFALIVAVQAFYDALPSELLASLPDATQSNITVVLAILGVIGRYINQSKPLPLAGEIKEDK